MRCPKCHYISFGSADRCRNCGYELALAIPPAEKPIDLPIHGEDEPIGPLSDFVLTERAPAPKGPAPSSDQGGNVARRAAAVARLDLPLFTGGGTADDAPLVAPGAVPRVPLSVRRAAPPIPRPRPERLEDQDIDDEIGAGDAQSDDPLRQRPIAWPRKRAAAPAVVREAKPLVAAPVARRLLAGVIDVAVLMAIDAGVLYSTLRLLELSVADFRVLPPIPLSVFFILLNGGYLALFTTAAGQTIGKMIAGIKVVTDRADADHDTDDAYLRVPLGSAVLRATAYLVSLMPAGLGFLPILLAADGRALHDRLAGTRVVRA